MPKRRYRGPAFWQARREDLLAEQRHACPYCRRRIVPNLDEVAVHHRRRRLGRDEDDDMVNLLLLHGDCHRLVHAHPAASRDGGFIVATWQEPGEVPKPSVG